MKDETELDELYLEAMRKWDDEGDCKAAFEMFSALAKQGYADAYNCLGIMYGEGEGVGKDDGESLYWHKRAGQKRNISSKNYYSNIALQYERMGNRRRAFYWWQKAVSSGIKEAGIELAKRLLQNGRSDSRKRAVELLRIAADAKFPLEISENDCEEAQELLNTLGEAS